MQELMLVWATGLVGVASLAAQELTVRRLPRDLSEAHERRRAQVDLLSEKYRWLTPLNRLTLVGYFLSIAAIDLDVAYAKYAYLLFTVGWTGLSVLHAPNIHHRIAVVFYEASLLLNGALLVVAFRMH